MANMKGLLSDLLRVDGIRGAVVVGRDGFVIDGATSVGRLDIEAIGAAISMGIGSAEVMGQAVGVNDFAQGMVEYKDGVIVMTLLGPFAILAIVADAKANLGNVRFQVKQRAPELMQSL